MLVATGSMWLLLGHPLGDGPNLTLCKDGLDGVVGIGPRSPGIQQRATGAGSGKGSPHPHQGIWEKPNFLRSFSKTESRQDPCFQWGFQLRAL